MVKLEKYNIEIDQKKPFVLISGPCQIESRDHLMMMAEKLKEITTQINVPLIFKSSFDKANRTSINGERGVGLEVGLKILQEVKDNFDIPIITDVHKEEQCAIVAEVADILQIPAFLSRQTDLLVAAAKTNNIVMVKKGQFLSPEDMVHVANKITNTGNNNVLLCDRGTSFGYNNLVSDFRGIVTMAATHHPVIFDATHSTQSLGGLNGKSGGDRLMAPVLTRAALAVGVAGIFAETHQDPDNAPSDGPAMIYLDSLPQELKMWKEIDDLRKSQIA